MIYQNILAAMFGNNWYASSEYMEAIVQFTDNLLAGKRAFDDLDRIHEYIQEENHIVGAHSLGRVGTPGTEIQLLDNGTAVVPITGIIAPKVSAIRMSMTGTSMEMLATRMKQMKADGDVKRVVLNINSGGGSVLGVPEAAEVIRELAKVKPVTAYFNHIGASAAYFLASAAGKRVVTASSITGSIGVYTIVATQARKLEKDGIDAKIIRAGAYKAVPNSIEPLEAQEKGIELVQADVDHHYRVFVNAIQRNLGISMQDAEKLADGTVTTGLEAINKGLADEAGNLEAVLAGDIEADVLSDKTLVASAEAALSNDDPAPEAEVEENPAPVAVDSAPVEDASEIAVLKAKLMLLEAEAEKRAAAEAEAAKVGEEAKISAIIETAITENRIAPMKAEEMKGLALQMGVEKFEKLLAAIPRERAVESHLDAPPTQRSENPYVAADKLDKFAPTSELEVEMFRRIPELAKKYGLNK